MAFTPSNAFAALDLDTLYAYASSFLVRHTRFKRVSTVCSLATSPTHSAREEAAPYKIEAGAVFSEEYRPDKSPLTFAFSRMQSSLECIQYDNDSTVLGCGLVNVKGVGLRAGENVEEQLDVFL